MTIEPASPADAEALAALSGQLGYPSSAEQIVTRLKDLPDDHRVWVARADGSVIAWLHAFIAHYLVDEPFVEIGGLVVADSERGKGVGPKLIDQASDWARALGCDRLGVHSNVLRVAAHRFYEREGFVLEKRQGVFSRMIGGER